MHKLIKNLIIQILIAKSILSLSLTVSHISPIMMKDIILHYVINLFHYNYLKHEAKYWLMLKCEGMDDVAHSAASHYFVVTLNPLFNWWPFFCDDLIFSCLFQGHLVTTFWAYGYLSVKQDSLPTIISKTWSILIPLMWVFKGVIGINFLSIYYLNGCQVFLQNLFYFYVGLSIF